MLKKILLILASLLIFIALCYGNAKYVNTNEIKIREEIIETNRLNENSNDILIAYFSDLHYGNFIDNNFLEKIVKTINDFNPDIIIFGGDLIDGYGYFGTTEEKKNDLISRMKQLKSKYGNYFILGNHDLYLNNLFIEMVSIIEDSGFTLLNNDTSTIYLDNNNYLNIIGMNPMTDEEANYNDIFSSINANNFTLVVSHYPDDFDKIIDNNFDYMLAGHSHGGQIYIPIVSSFIAKEGCRNYFRGKTTKNNKTLDITKGVGRTEIDARFLADAEIVLYRLSPINN